ncbi:hypothetical protein SprV_0200689000 [Sparganum proliferum]
MDFKADEREVSPPSRVPISGTFFSNSAPLVICGPSGSGKSSIISRLIQNNPGVFEVSISHTTRSKRPNEIAGKDYFFITKEEFERAIKCNEFVEYAVFSGNYYGTSKEQMQKVIQRGKICIFELDIQGVEQIKKTDIHPVYIFIRPRNYATLEKRLRTNSVESEEHILQRLAVAHQEIQYALEDEIFTKVVINDKIENAVRDIELFLKQDERFGAYFSNPRSKGDFIPVKAT